MAVETVLTGTKKEGWDAYFAGGFPEDNPFEPGTLSADNWTAGMDAARRHHVEKSQRVYRMKPGVKTDRDFTHKHHTGDPRWRRK